MALGSDEAARAHLTEVDELGGRFDNIWLESSARTQLAVARGAGRSPRRGPGAPRAVGGRERRRRAEHPDRDLLARRRRPARAGRGRRAAGCDGARRGRRAAPACGPAGMAVDAAWRGRAGHPGGAGDRCRGLRGCPRRRRRAQPPRSGRPRPRNPHEHRSAAGDGRVGLYAGFCPRAPCGLPMGGHPSRPAVAGRLERSTRRLGRAALERLRRTTARPSVSLLDLAPGGVYRATPVTRCAVVSYTTVSPLPVRALAVCSLWHCPAGHPGSLLTTTLPCGARTFLGGGVSPADATAQPTRPSCDQSSDPRPSRHSCPEALRSAP